MARQRRGRGRESRRDRRQRLLGSRSSRETPLVNIPELPDPVEVARNLPSSVGRSASSLYNLLQPPDVGGNIVDWVTGEDKAEWFTEEQRAMGRVVSDFSRLWSEDRQIYQNRSEFQEKFPYAAAAGQAFLESTPFGSQGWSGFVEHLEQEPAEWLLDIGLSATGAGAGVAGLRRAARWLPDVPTPMQQFARQWTQVDPASVPYSPGRFVGGNAPDFNDLNMEMGMIDDYDFIPDVPSDFSAVVPTRQSSRIQNQPFNYDLEGAYSAPHVREPTAFEQLQSSRPAWQADAATEAQLRALRSKYPDTDYAGITKREAGDLLSFEFHEAIYEGDPVDYRRAAKLDVALPDPMSAVQAQSWRAPEYVPQPDVLEWLHARADADARFGNYMPEYEFIHRGDTPDRTSAAYGIYGTPQHPEIFGPHPRGNLDYHSGEITGNKFDLGAREIAIGSGVSLGVGGAAYGVHRGWQSYIGGEPAFQAKPVTPHLTDDERTQALREIEGGGLATANQITALTRMYPDRDFDGLTKSEASELFDNFTPAPKMATVNQITALQRMYPDRNLDGLTRDEASELFSGYTRPERQRSDTASEAQISYLNQLRGGGSNVLPIEDVNESDGLTRTEVSTLIDFEKAKLRSERINRESRATSEPSTSGMASEGQLRYLAQLNPELYGGLAETGSDVMPIEDVTFDDGITREEASTLFDYEQAVKKSEESVPASPAMASTAQVAALKRIYPDQFGREPEPEVEPANWLNTNISDGITRQEAAHLFRSSEIRKEMQGPEMASDAQMSALRRAFPDRFEPEPETPVTPLEQIDFTDGVTRDEAREAFRHVKESPPPMATKRQVEALEREFPHAFKQLGDAEQYLQSGQSYGIVQSLEDIYDADTFTGRLYDSETGQTLKEDTVRLGDFNAPEIRPDQFKPKEYQEREAARAREARDIFRSFVERYNIGRDTESEGYVIPIEYRQDSAMPGGLERGLYGRVLGDVNFEGIDYEQFMIQQGQGSVYGAQVEWGAEEIDAASLWRRSPTYTEQLGDSATKALWNIPGNLVGGLLDGRGTDVIGDTFRGTLSGLKDDAISKAKGTAVRATTDFFKERFTDEFTPNNLGFVERYVGDLGGLGGKAGNFLKSGAGSVLGGLALAAGTFYLGERSLDAGYEEVIPTVDETSKDFYDQFRMPEGVRNEGGTRREGLLLAQIERMLRRVLRETGDGSFSKAVTKIGRESKIQKIRGLS